MRADKARRNLADFVRQAWPVIEPQTPLLWNWHIDAIAEHLQAVTRGDIQRLVINIPPGHCKSIIVSVMWPAWEWIEAPHIRSLFASYAFDLATRDSARCREVMNSEWYQQSFAPIWQLRDNEWDFSDDQNAKHWFQNTRQGFRFSLSVGGRATGFRGNKVVVDDPLNARELHSKATRDEAIFWWDKVMSSRLNDPRTGARVMIMQRLHEEDPTGYVLKQGGYEHLCLPSEFRPDRRSITFAGHGATRREFWHDPRQHKDDLLHPALFTEAVLARAKKDLDTEYEGQHQQQPSPDEGAILKRLWWKYYTRRPEKFDEVIQSWDMAFKDTKTSAYVVGQVWGRIGANRYLLASVREKMGFTATCDALITLSSQWPEARAKLVEEKANGAAILDQLKNKISGLLPIVPNGSKEARAWAAQPELKAGNCFLPALSLPEDPQGSPVLEPWVLEFIRECATFPHGSYADQVDTFTQAQEYFSRCKGVENVANPFA